jgi:GT2 family glycosyltransferase
MSFSNEGSHSGNGVDRNKGAKGARLSVVVPVSDAAATLEACLAALAASALPRRSWELIVVDDGSSDDSALIASRHADAVVRLPGVPHGPAYARNRGVEVARAPFVAFVDADVCVHPDALGRMLDALETDATLGGVYGTYDDARSPDGIVSDYRNLVRHFVHLRHAGDTDVFWSACGAVRRSVLVEAGMYDEWHFPRPQIESVELGHRIRSLGFRIRLDPRIQGTHLKRWSLGSLLMSEARDRGLPRTRLLRDTNPGVRDSDYLRDTGGHELLGVALAGVCIAVPTLIGGTTGWLALGILTAGLIFVNRRLYGFFTVRGGHLFALAAVGLHLVVHLFHAVAMATGWMLRHVIGEPHPEPVVQAFSEVGVETWPPLPVKRGIDPLPRGNA